MTDLTRPLFDYDAWCAEVRDPALASLRQEVHEDRQGRASISYALAPIPKGWAWRGRFTFSDGSGSGAPWHGPYPTRRDAEKAAIAHLLSASSPDRNWDEDLDGMGVLRLRLAAREHQDQLW